MRLPSGYTLDHLSESDCEQTIALLNNSDVFKYTCRIPKIYTKESFATWFKRTQDTTTRFGHALDWAIRTPEGLLAGSVGFVDFDYVPNHKAQIGYWIGTPYRGNNFATEAVVALCKYGMKNYHLNRIEAVVMVGNPSSERVLEKAGFEREGFSKAFIKKDGHLIDVNRFALVR